jgi:transcriptional regulator with XRE-family HTH domain
MNIGARFRDLRESMNLTQGDIEERSGLIRCYISRVENGFTIPSIETLERMARSLDLPIYFLFYTDTELAKLLHLPKPLKEDENLFGNKPDEARFLRKFRRVLHKAKPKHVRFLLNLAKQMARERGR